MKRKLTLLFYCTIWITPFLFAQQKTDSKAYKSVLRNIDFSKVKNVDNKPAFEMNLHAAENGDIKAMYAVGELYRSGIGVEKNQKAAFKWYEKAAKLGSPRSWYRLGMMYKYGSGGKELDFKKAYECFSSAADLGSPDGWFSQGYMLYKGLGCTQDYTQAFSLFVKASRSNLPEAMYFMALCMRNGYGTAVNEQMAKYWLVQSAKLGEKQAVAEFHESKPENIDGELTDKIKLAERLNRISTGSIRSFKNNEHDGSIKESSIVGSYSGYILKYDWSGKHVIGISSLRVSLQKGDNKNVNGTWIEDDSIQVKLNGNLTSQGLVFTNVQYKKKDHYNKVAAALSFDHSKLQFFNKYDSTFLAGSLQLFAVEKKEPERPMYIVLVKNNSQKQSSSTLAQKISINGESAVENSFVSLESFPNPVINTLNLSFTLNNNSNVKVGIYDITGKKVYDGATQYLLKGKQNISLQPRILGGIYVVKLYCGANDTRICKIVKK